MIGPITARARSYLRTRATEVMEYHCQIRRGQVPEGYDEDTLIFTPQGPGELLYEGQCRVWEVSNASSVIIGDADLYQANTRLSIPWNTSAVIKRYDQVTILTAPQDSQMVGKRYEIQTVDKAGELRATRTFEVVGLS